ncbi:hypothetical protein [Cupriavidus sp. IDO]|uniref:hypothetical protein n=1 Tax=Cupriavidus sp. IDO TaxID=1539142 RepID=UPI000AAD17A6|nr:hypothetical protein [Cupriavidus sp. IDO]
MSVLRMISALLLAAMAVAACSGNGTSASRDDGSNSGRSSRSTSGMGNTGY